MASTSQGYRSISDIGVSHVCATAKAQLGDRQFHLGNEYVYVYNAGNSAISPGFGLTCSAVTGYSVTISSTSGVDLCAGYVKNATAATADYFWALVAGFATVEADADTGLAAADQVVLGADGVSTRVTGATGYKAAPHGRMMTATASAGSSIALVRCFL